MRLLLPGCAPGYFDWLNSLADKPTGGLAVRRDAREEPRQLPHVIENDRLRPFERAPRGEAPGIAEGAHAGRAGGFDAVAAVLDDRARGRRDAHAARRVQEKIGGRFAACDLTGAEDPAGEALVEPGEPQGEPDLLVRPARGDARRERDRVERLDDTRHRRELGRERVAVEVAKGLLPVARKAAPQVRLDLAGHLLVRPPHEAVDDLGFGQGPAEPAQYDDVDLD